MKTEHEDLRVKKTKAAIYAAFHQLLATMPYELITVKELTELAQINRKTFYLHYPTLDDLLYEIQDDIAHEFAALTANYSSIEDMPAITRQFFQHSEGQDIVRQRILTGRGSGRNEQNRAMRQTMDLNRRHIDSMGEMSDAMHNIIEVFLTSASTAIYQQWIRDGRKIPLEDIIDITSQLVCNGVLSLETEHIRK